MRRLYRRAIALLPDTAGAYVEYKLGFYRDFFPWGGAFNGQTVRRELVRRCVVRLKPNFILETGTYRGTTTEFFADFGRKVVSVESNRRFYEFSRRRLAPWPNVDVVLGRSQEVLRRQDVISSSATHVFAYLDAHGQEHLPLRDEIDAISDMSAGFIILVDDFEVPHDDGYKFDDYAEAGSCTLSHIQQSISSEMQVYFPVTPSREETGVKTGYCFIARGAEQIALLDDFSELAPAGASEWSSPKPHG